MTAFVSQEVLIETLKNQIIEACISHAPVIIRMLSIAVEKHFYYPVIECIPGLELDERIQMQSIRKAILLAKEQL